MSFYKSFADNRSTSAGSWLVKKMFWNVFLFVQPFLSKPESRILEIGPGRGALCNIFLSQGFRNYTVVEPSPLLRCSFEELDVETKDYRIPHLIEEDTSYDGIILVNVFEHLNGGSEAQEFVEEARRVLKKEGLLVIGSPDYLHLKEEFFNCDYSHNNVTTLNRTRQLFVDNGFEILRHTYTSSFIFGFSATLVSYLVSLGFFWVRGSSHLGIVNRLYKMKLSFLRSFLIVGCKQSE
ncbi:MAG: class I SAM-dependent methyltransferase [Anaerolineaceae bacterium]|nr:class I SAM-dependent methyltransferase [Anaerolineaceae bacterium]